MRGHELLQADGVLGAGMWNNCRACAGALGIQYTVEDGADKQ